MKKILFVIVCLFVLIPVCSASENYTYGVSKKEKELIQEEKKNDRGFFEDLRYRFTEKETHDSYDYFLLSLIIISIVIVVIFLNKKTVITLKEESVFSKE